MPCKCHKILRIYCSFKILITLLYQDHHSFYLLYSLSYLIFMNRHSHDEYEVKTKVVTLSTSSNQTSLLIRELNTNNLTMKEKN